MAGVEEELASEELQFTIMCKFMMFTHIYLFIKPLHPHITPLFMCTPVKKLKWRPLLALKNKGCALSYY